jgi:hypothetical protein
MQRLVEKPTSRDPLSFRDLDAPTPSKRETFDEWYDRRIMEEVNLAVMSRVPEMRQVTEISSRGLTKKTSREGEIQ